MAAQIAASGAVAPPQLSLVGGLPPQPLPGGQFGAPGAPPPQPPQHAPQPLPPQHSQGQVNQFTQQMQVRMAVGKAR